MTKSPKHRPFRRGAPTARLAALALLCASILPVSAETPSDRPGHRQGPPAAQSTPPRDTPPGQTGPQSKLPPPRADGAKPLDPLPQTADEKARKLADLYAQLAAADSEDAAKKIGLQIERLWRISGSDTVNLLIGRANKAMADTRMDLAEKLLDEAVTLAPDYTEGFSQRAFLHYKQNNLRAAAGDLRRVLALDPNHYKAMEGLAQIWRDGGNKKAAYQVMKQLRDVNPFAPGLKQTFDELKREVEGQGI